jgi:ubiquinone/menaquinone biosynthesis C-methylase UbiE
MAEVAPAPGLQQQPATWDAVAPTYAQDMAQWRAYADEALRSLPLAASDRVLDVAAGPGPLTFAAAPHVAHVNAVDFSAQMVEELVARANRDGVSNVEGAVMDAQALSFPDGAFDAAFCLFAFFFFPDRARAFQELHRVLRPGGHALIATWGPIERRPIMRLGFEAMAKALPQFPRPAKGELQQPGECVEEMSQAGFHDVSAHLFTASVRVGSAEQYLDMILRSGAPFAVMKKKLDPASWDAAIGRILDALRPEIPAGGCELSAEAIFTVGTR